MFVISLVINIGMWFERFVIIVTSLHRDFLPSSWDYFRPTIWDISCLLGSFGLFFTMFCLFVRFVPMVATAEVKTVLPQANPHYEPIERPPDAPAARGATRGHAHFGILARFTDPAALYCACERVRDAGYTLGPRTRPSRCEARPGDGHAASLTLDHPGDGADGRPARPCADLGSQLAYPLVILASRPSPARVRPDHVRAAVLFGRSGSLRDGLARLPCYHPLFPPGRSRLPRTTRSSPIEAWDPGSTPWRRGACSERPGLGVEIVGN
jgi:hypothetical protein